MADINEVKVSLVSLCSELRFRAGRVTALPYALSDFDLFCHFGCAMVKLMDEISFFG